MQLIKRRSGISDKANTAVHRRHEANERLIFAATNTTKAVLKEFETEIIGLDEAHVSEHRAKYGDNKIIRSKQKFSGRRLIEAFVNPFTGILFFLAIVSMMTDIIIPIYRNHLNDVSPITVIIIVMMICISGTLRFIQESRSGNAAQKLLALITTTCTVLREGMTIQEIPIEELVVGDIIRLSAGDMIPGDVRIVDAKDLFVTESALTGESDPVEKVSDIDTNIFRNVTDFNNIGFMGSSVISGTATAIVIAVGEDTLFGNMAASAAEDSVETNFTKGINAVSWVLIRFMFVMVPVVFFVNGITKGDWISALLFAISVAVGLTPEMLPMIVTTCLAKGAVFMSKKKTIVKNLNAIQNLGAMDILCTDKTGTLTQDKVVLEYHLDVEGKENIRVLCHAYLNSYFQTGYKNLMDLAIIAKTEEQENSQLNHLSSIYHKVDEIPFDFKRRRLSTVVEDLKGKRQIVTKGAVEEMLSICTYVEFRGEVQPLTKNISREILMTVNTLNENGMRVIAVAQKTLNVYIDSYTINDESDMVLIGYLAFLDPPKESAADAIHVLREHGVRTKILTGDNDRVTRCICKQVGLNINNLLLGSDIEGMDDEVLRQTVLETDVFAKLSPDQKARIVAVLHESGHTVGFLGDGINDAAAMKAADVGISVDNAVDIAKESADIILLEKNLMVLEQGIVEGRKTYANMIKYIKMTSSSNFGNMFSVLAASALLPFLPMQSLQLILLNLIYDLSCTAIPWDNVDLEYTAVPRNWDASSVGKFMIWLGLTSSIFDWTTYAFMYFVFCPIFVSHGILYNELSEHFQGTELAHMQVAYAAMFQAGWFIESIWSQTLVIHMIRTPKLSFVGSRASVQLTLLTFAGIVLLTVIPFTSIGSALGFVALPSVYFAYLIPCIVLYMALATSVKKAYVRHYGELL